MIKKNKLDTFLTTNKEAEKQQLKFRCFISEIICSHNINNIQSIKKKLPMLRFCDKNIRNQYR